MLGGGFTQHIGKVAIDYHLGTESILGVRTNLIDYSKFSQKEEKKYCKALIAALEYGNPYGLTNARKKGIDAVCERIYKTIYDYAVENEEQIISDEETIIAYETDYSYRLSYIPAHDGKIDLVVHMD